MEKLADEMPAVRAANIALTDKSNNDDRIIARDTELLAMKDKVIEANERAFLSEQRRADDEMKARMSTETAVTILRKENGELQTKVKKANQRTFIAAVAAIATYLIFR